MTPEHLPTEQYDAQLAEKVVRLQSMMTPFNAPVPEVFRSPVSHYRMRAEFRIWHDVVQVISVVPDAELGAHAVVADGRAEHLGNGRVERRHHTLQADDFLCQLRVVLFCREVFWGHDAS